jgi:hypothetical protein
MNNRLSRREERMLQQSGKKNRDLDWEELLALIDDKQGCKVIPIVGGSVTYESLFLPLMSALGMVTEDEDSAGQPVIPGIDHWLAREWSRELKYPLPDNHEMPRVAQYCLSIREKKELVAKQEYLNFIKQMLIDLAADTGVDEEIIEGLEAGKNDLTVDQIAQNLALPAPPQDGSMNALEVLAKLPFRIYVTTSYHIFLEEALRMAGREPRTQVCFWRSSSGLGNIHSDHKTAPENQPDAKHPVVLHLYGLEQYPNTLVLCEDNYLDFLTCIAQDNNMQAPIIPVYLREALDSSSVLLLGYRLQDLDFRVLFRYLNLRPAPLRTTSMIIQLTPEQQYRIANAEEAGNYLKMYFKEPFKLQWGSTQDFLNRLLDDYNNRSGPQ